MGPIYPADFHNGLDPKGALARKIVVVAGSVGGLPAFRELLGSLPADFPAAIVFVQHLPPSRRYRSRLCELLAAHSKLPVKWVEPGELLMPGMVYLAPQDVQTRVDSYGTFALSPMPCAGSSRPAANPLFVSVAQNFGADAVAVVLSGHLSDGADGALRIAEAGGIVLAQDEETSLVFDMPRAVICNGAVDFVLSPKGIANALIALLMAPGADAWFRVGKALVPSILSNGDEVDKVFV